MRRGCGGPTCRSAESPAPPSRPAAVAPPGASAGRAAGGAAPTVRSARRAAELKTRKVNETARLPREFGVRFGRRSAAYLPLAADSDEQEREGSEEQTGGAPEQ